MEYIEYIDDQTKDKHLIYCATSHGAAQVYNCKYCNFKLTYVFIFDRKLKKLRNTYITSSICLTNEERIIIDIIN